MGCSEALAGGQRRERRGCNGFALLKDMRRSVSRVATIALVAVALVAGIACLRPDALRIWYHRLSLNRVEMGMYYQMNPPKTFPQWISSLMVEPWNSSSLWEKLGHEEDALVRLGYLGRYEFPFTNRTLNAIQLRDTAQTR